MNLVILVIFAGILAVDASYDFETFVRDFNKEYRSAAEFSMRRAIFTENQKFIDRFNEEKAGKLGFELGLSHLADLTPEEMSVRRGLKVPSDFGSHKNSPESERFFANLMANVSDDQIPDEMDWRKVPERVSAVKDQGQCGSCWAFSTTGVLEGQMALRSKDKKLIPLSEQNLVDCSKNNGGCYGGFMDRAMDDIKAEQGIESEQSYPYKGDDGQACKFNKSKVIFTDNGVHVLKWGDEKLLKKTVAIFGPVAVAIDASTRTWHNYKKGIYTDDTCNRELKYLDHAVLVVGYGTDKEQGIDYWIVKNSWGSSWGDHGYIKMARNWRSLCGIATAAMIPIF